VAKTSLITPLIRRCYFAVVSLLFAAVLREKTNKSNELGECSRKKNGNSGERAQPATAGRETGSVYPVYGTRRSAVCCKSAAFAAKGAPGRWRKRAAAP
jgi:hypothetical protein